MGAATEDMEKPVTRADVPAVIDAGDNRFTSMTAHAGVNDTDKNALGRKFAYVCR